MRPPNICQVKFIFLFKKFFVYLHHQCLKPRNMSKVIIGRPINGISLNGDEYLLDDKGDFMVFDDRSKAMDFLRENGHEDWSDDELHDAYNFKPRYPFNDGDGYWTVKPSPESEYEDNSGIYENGIVATYGIWDEDSQKEYDSESGADITYYNSLDEILRSARDVNEFVLVIGKTANLACYDIVSGDYLVYNEETGKFFASY